MPNLSCQWCKRPLQPFHFITDVEGKPECGDCHMRWCREPRCHQRVVSGDVPSGNRPRIVCLCGSTRFKEAFDDANYRETMAGRIVLSVGFFMHATDNQHGGHVGATPEQKVELDRLHKRKIDIADEVLVLNVGGYIGDSTRSEIEYAMGRGVPVRYLEAR